MFPRTIHKYRRIEPVNKCISREIPAAEINYGHVRSSYVGGDRSTIMHDREYRYVLL